MPANAPATHDNADLIIEDDEPDDPFAPPPQETVPWRILIVDDDVDVHVVTKFALSNSHFQGRRLSFLHAYSGKEALTILRDTPDIAMVLLDVIMETNDAGLRVARQIRSELGNDLVRIVLRTGQPGQTLEHSIILDYDINDFWCKADLTTRKLFTTVIASLRAYATLSAAQAERAALAAALEKAQQVHTVIEQHALVLTLDAQGRISDANEMLCRTANIARDQLIGRDLRALHAGPYPEPLTTEVLSGLARDGSWAGEIAYTAANGVTSQLHCVVHLFHDDGGKPHQIVAVATLAPH